MTKILWLLLVTTINYTDGKKAGESTEYSVYQSSSAALEKALEYKVGGRNEYGHPFIYFQGHRDEYETKSLEVVAVVAGRRYKVESQLVAQDQKIKSK